MHKGWTGNSGPPYVVGLELSIALVSWPIVTSQELQSNNRVAHMWHKGIANKELLSIIGKRKCTEGVNND